MKDVARGAGVSHALVSHYFGTYDALVEAVLERRAEAIRRGGFADLVDPTGDIQPRGYPGDEVERSDGRDPVDDTGIVADVLKLLGAV